MTGYRTEDLGCSVVVCLDEGCKVKSETHLTAQRHLENVSVTASTEKEVLAGVKGHRHDLHVKQDGQEQLT